MKIRPNASKALRRYLPATAWIPSYRIGWLRYDLIAGITLWGLLVPEAIAYAGMAGAPAQAGLYTLLVSLAAYAVLGSSRQMVAAATSSTSIMIAAALAPLLAANPGRYATYLAALVISVGVVFLVAGLLRLGFIANFMSEPVMTGFVFGLAAYIAVHQLPKVFGVSKGEGDTLQQLWHVVTQLGKMNWYTFAIGAGAFFLLFVLHKWAPRVPGALVVLVLGIIAVTAFDLAAKHGVAIAGDIPRGLPSGVWPGVSGSELVSLLPGAFGITLVALAETLGVARTFADKHGYDVDTNQDMIALGVGNIGSGFLGGLVAGGGMSSSTVNDQGGARTEMSTLVTALLSLLTVLFLTPLFKNLPEAVLGAIVIHAVLHLMKVRELKRYLAWKPVEFWLAVTALVGVIAIEILPGLLIAVVLSLLMLVWRASRPLGSVLGKVPGEEGGYSSIERHPENRIVPGLVIFRFDRPLFFANEVPLRDLVRGLLKRDPPPTMIILDLQLCPDLDISAVDMLLKLVDEAGAAGIEVVFAEVIAAVREILRRSGLLEKVGGRPHPAKRR
jgi:SulP family sulfate permease